MLVRFNQSREKFDAFFYDFSGIRLQLSISLSAHVIFTLLEIYILGQRFVLWNNDSKPIFLLITERKTDYSAVYFISS